MEKVLTAPQTCSVCVSLSAQLLSRLSFPSSLLEEEKEQQQHQKRTQISHIQAWEGAVAGQEGDKSCPVLAVHPVLFPAQ